MGIKTPYFRCQRPATAGRLLLIARVLVSAEGS
jgi:hypothetical protein